MLLPKKIKYSHFLLVTCLLSLVSFLWWHFRLGNIRYFDVDEFAHLHYASHMLTGKKPYVDFQSFFPPGFAVFLMPAFITGWGTVRPFLTARIFMFLVFGGICLFSGLIFLKMRKSPWGAVFAATVLAFLPMPFDKFLEVRPDNPATLLVLAGMYFQIRSMEKKKIADGIVSGLSYSLSYLVLPKTIPNIAVAVLIALIWSINGKNVRKQKDLTAAANKLKPFVTGLAVPVILFFLWTLTLGNISTVFYSLFRLPVEANKISRYFIMMPTLFFYPNGIFYGSEGWNTGLIVNHVLWVLGLGMGAYRLFTPYLTGKKEMVFAEVLVAAQFYIQVAFYVLYVPLRHAQYLIPVAVFVGWYVADFVLAVWNKIYMSDKSNIAKYGKYAFLCLFIILNIYLYKVFLGVNEVKLAWTNRQLLSDISMLYQKVPAKVPVLDLDGRMLYNPDAYYACCIPFGQSMEFYSRPLPDLPQTLENEQVKYINQGGLERVNTLPPAWQQYIYGTYEPLDGDKTMLVRK